MESVMQEGNVLNKQMHVQLNLKWTVAWFVLLKHNLIEILILFSRTNDNACRRYFLF